MPNKAPEIIARALQAALVFGGIAAQSVPASSQPDEFFSNDHQQTPQDKFSPAEQQLFMEDAHTHFKQAQEIVRNGGDAIEQLNVARAQINLGGGYEHAPKDMQPADLDVFDRLGAVNALKHEFTDHYESLDRQVRNGEDCSEQMEQIAILVGRVGGYDAPGVAASGWNKNNTEGLMKNSLTNGIIKEFDLARNDVRWKNHPALPLAAIADKYNRLIYMGAGDPFETDTLKARGITVEAVADMRATSGRNEAQKHFREARRLYARGESNLIELDKALDGIQKAGGLANAGIDYRQWLEIDGPKIDKWGNLFPDDNGYWITGGEPIRFERPLERELPWIVQLKIPLRPLSPASASSLPLSL